MRESYEAVAHRMIHAGEMIKEAKERLVRAGKYRSIHESNMPYEQAREKFLDEESFLLDEARKSPEEAEKMMLEDVVEFLDEAVKILAPDF